MNSHQSTSSLDVHRLLDEAFAGVPMTPELQDLKEEMRANLAARVGELEAEGVPPAAAARRAIAELGDVRGVVEEMTGGPVDGLRASGTAAFSSGAAWRRHKVRPRPAFVVRTVLASLIGAGALAAVVLGVLGRLDLVDGAVSSLWSGLATAVLAIVGAGLVADALRQETTTNYPVPARRAAGYGVATALAVAGLGGCVQYVGIDAVGFLVGGTALAIGSACLFAALGATQTNRHKAWVVRLRAEHEAVGDRFERDPEAAARFGVYTVVIWTVALTVCVVVGLVAGWVWSPLALLGGGVVMMLTLARMLFAPSADGSAPRSAARTA